MGNIKVILKISLVLQILVCVLAFYGHPDVESIDFGSPTQVSRDQIIIEAAIKRGMDGDAVAELLRTKTPVTRKTTTPSGFTKTTTYKLEPDGSITSKSVLQKRHRYVYNSDSIPDDLKNSPTGTVTKTFIDSNGNKVTQTIAVTHDKPAQETDDLNGDLFGKHVPTWKDSTPSFPAFETNHRTYTRTFSTPQGERRTVQSWPETFLNANNNNPNFRRTNTTFFTSTDPHTFSIPKESQFPPIDDTKLTSFDDSIFSQPWDNLEPDNEDGWEVIKDPEVTTKKHFETWTPKTWNWPEFPTHPTTAITTTARSKLNTEPETTTRRTLPNLEDFLKSQYGRPINSEPTASKTFITTTPKSLSTTTKFINIEDLPVHEVLHNGKPAEENILKTLPPYLTPRTPTATVLNVQHKYPIEEVNADHTPKAETNVRTFSTTHMGPEKPRLKDLDPQIQNILTNAGIVPEMEGDSITKTRTEPDGRVITTTYKVNSMPSPPTVHFEQPHKIFYPFNPYNPEELMPATPTHLSNISDFLAKFGLTKIDISSRNGRYTKTFIDDNGDVLTATFVLT